MEQESKPAEETGQSEFSGEKLMTAPALESGSRILTLIEGLSFLNALIASTRKYRAPLLLVATLTGVVTPLRSSFSLRSAASVCCKTPRATA